MMELPAINSGFQSNSYIRYIQMEVSLFSKFLISQSHPSFKSLEMSVKNMLMIKKVESWYQPQDKHSLQLHHYQDQNYLKGTL